MSGFTSLAEAVALRDDVLRQLEWVDTAEDIDERTARCTFVVVGAGYTGTELAAQLQSVREVARRYPRLAETEPRRVPWDVRLAHPTARSFSRTRSGQPD